MTSLLEAVVLTFLAAVMAIVIALMLALAFGPERATRVWAAIARFLDELLRRKNDGRS